MNSWGYNAGGESWPGDYATFEAFRAPNESDGEIVKRKFYGESAQRSPEHWLLLAVLDQALADLRAVGNTSCKRFERRVAREWFEDRAEGVFSFVWVCEHLGFDPGYVRRGLGIG